MRELLRVCQHDPVLAITWAVLAEWEAYRCVRDVFIPKLIVPLTGLRTIRLIHRLPTVLDRCQNRKLHRPIPLV